MMDFRIQNYTIGSTNSETSSDFVWKEAESGCFLKGDIVDPMAFVTCTDKHMTMIANLKYS